MKRVALPLILKSEINQGIYNTGRVCHCSTFLFIHDKQYSQQCLLTMSCNAFDWE